MSAPVHLNNAQLSVLQWIGEGSPPGVMPGYTHRTSAVALRTRGLIRISGRGQTWRAQLTPAGESFLSNPPPRPVHRSVRRSPSPDPTPHAPSTSGPKAKATTEITVPAQLRGAHPFVLATRDAAAGQTAGPNGRIYVGPAAGVFRLVVSRTLLRRTLLVLHALTHESIRRGWDLAPYPGERRGPRVGVAIQAHGHLYPVEVHELTETLPLTQDDISAWRNEKRWWTDEDRSDKLPPPQRKRTQATGRLKLVLPNGYGGGRASWAEGLRGPLESKLTSMFRVLEQRIADDDQRDIERTRAAEAHRREQVEREAHARQLEIENARVDRLLREAAAWRRSSDVREYVAALGRRLPELDEPERARVEQWHAWAQDWADRSDPVVRTALIAGLNENSGSTD